MNDESLNETSIAAKPVSIRRRRFPLKIAVSAVVGVVQSGYLLGGNTGSLDLSLRISPRAGAENAALAAAVAARIRALEFELANLDDSVRSHLDALRLLVVSAQRKAQQAARRLELADRIRRFISLRKQSGLEGSQAVITAEADVSRARAELHGAESERNTAWTHLLVACGCSGAGTDMQKALSQERQSGKLKNIETEGLR